MQNNQKNENESTINLDSPESQVISLEPTLHLNNISVFDIGANKDFFNKGLINHEIRTHIPEKISQLFNKKLSNSSATHKTTIAIPGYALNQLKIENPELISQIKNKIKNKELSLSSQTYSGTSSTILSDNELISEIKKHELLLKNTFDQEPESIIIDHNPSEKLINTFSNKKIIISNNIKQTNLQKKVVDEIKKLKPHVSELNDQDLINELNLLASNQILNKLDETQANIEFSPYEQYSNVMNMLNDVVHRINNFKNSEEGIVNEVSISEEPSTLLIK